GLVEPLKSRCESIFQQLPLPFVEPPILTSILAIRWKLRSQVMDKRLSGFDALARLHLLVQHRTIEPDRNRDVDALVVRWQIDGRLFLERRFAQSCRCAIAGHAVDAIQSDRDFRWLTRW